MSFNLGTYLKTNPNAIKTEQGKIVISLPFEAVIESIKNGMDERAKRIINIYVKDSNIIIEFDTATLLGATDLSKLIPK